MAETGNAAAMREALNDVLLALDEAGFKAFVAGDPLAVAVLKAGQALAAPARNCDVGTAEEQYRRHQQYCDVIRDSPRDSRRCMDASTCSFCFAKWAQMPYKEGDGNA